MRRVEGGAGPHANRGDRLTVGVARYAASVWRSRYFWLNLALCDLRARYQRSALGVAWAMLQPLGLTLMFSFVLSRIFSQEIRDYAPFVFSGIVTWEYFGYVCGAGANSLTNSAAYIRQAPLPMAIYPLRSVLAGLGNYLLGLLGLILWMVVTRATFDAHWLAIVLTVPLAVVLFWPFAILAGFASLYVRETQQLLVLFVQGFMFVTPVLFRPEQFRSAGLDELLFFNPMYHVLELVRAPILRSEWPAAENYLVVLAWSAVLWVIASLLVAATERRAVFRV